jgi:hypothetical protein
MQGSGEDMLGESQTLFCIQDNGCLGEMYRPSGVRVCNLKRTGKVAIVIQKGETYPALTQEGQEFAVELG